MIYGGANGQPLFSDSPETDECQAEAPIILGAFWTVLPLRVSHFPSATLDFRAHPPVVAGWLKRSEQFGPCPRFMCDHEDPKGIHAESQGTPDSREASWRTAIQAAYAWLKGKQV